MSKKDLIRTLSLSPRYGVDQKPTIDLEVTSPRLEKKPSLGLISPRMLQSNLKSSQSFYKQKKLPPLKFKILIGGDDNTGKTRFVEKKKKKKKKKKLNFKFIFILLV